MNLNEIIGRRVHAQLAQPARVVLDQRNFPGHGSIRADAVEGVVRGVESGYITIDADAVYTPDDDARVPGEMGLPAYAQTLTLMHPLKHLGSIQLMD